MRPRILIVDDDDAVLEALLMALENDYDVMTARNGEDALEVMATESVDVVLLDLMMPVLDGEGYLREHMVRHAQVPVVAMSAGKDLRVVAQTFGVADTLTKPFRLDALKKKLDALTKGSGDGGDEPPPAAGHGGRGPGSAPGMDAAGWSALGAASW